MIKIKELDDELKVVEEKIQWILATLPIFLESVPVGKDEKYCKYRNKKKAKTFDFEIKDHIGEKLIFLDFERAAKTGTRFVG